ncbi:MAG: FlgO family outer membrane protein [Chloroherpetonaceae bacterium]|nr:FlgO family outer membrane protein [Chthonomonadaceae bacterium]MDW8206889.1 FlgO family outer membrane protein [Chloroherpetonaceae bacterium]
MRSPCLALCVALLLCGSVRAATSHPALKETTAGITIAVADFSGADKELGRFIAETLLTVLAQSRQLNLVERGEIRQALAELKLQSSGLVQPQEVKRLGALVSADRLIVGSYLVREDQIIINARLLDVKTGRLAAGGAASVSGKRSDLLAITQRLAQQFHQRVTGSRLPLEERPASPELGDYVHAETAHADLPEGNRRVSGQPPVSRTGARRPAESTDSAGGEEEEEATANAHYLERLRRSGLIPNTARLKQAVSEQEFIALVGRLSRFLPVQTDPPIRTQTPQAPVSRIRALVALVKVVAPPERVDTYRDRLLKDLPEDIEDCPAWSRPYVAAAIEQGIWRPGEIVRGRRIATWAFVALLLERMSVLDSDPDAVSTSTVIGTTRYVADPDAYTGLIVDAVDLRLNRTMNLRILDEAGNVVYPDPRHIPDYNFLLDEGLAAYCTSAREARRAGSRPLIVRAIDVKGAHRGDIVVTNQTAERIRMANRRGHFLDRWSVCVLVNPRD